MVTLPGEKIAQITSDTASGRVPLSGYDFIAAACLLVLTLGTVICVAKPKG